MSASENRASVKDGHTSTASQSRAAKPDALATVVAAGAFQLNGVFFAFPVLAVSAVAVGQRYVVLLRANIDIADWLAIAGPAPIEREPLIQEAVTIAASLGCTATTVRGHWVCDKPNITHPLKRFNHMPCSQY